MTHEQLKLFPDEETVIKANKSKSKNKFFDYNSFVDKFTIKKTTDDCYTPPGVYNAVLDFVKELTPLDGRPIVRPFYPGGDYVNYPYPEDCVVIDNPPFSIYSKIVRFYIATGIDFFLFAPQLTQFVINADCCYVVTCAHVTYENGAVVNTSFTTNIVKDLRLWLCPELKDRIEKAQKVEKPIIGKNTYPDEVVTPAILGKVINRGIEFKIKKEDCVYIKNLDSLKQKGKSIFGGGLLLSERAAAEKAAAERAAAERAAAERAAAERAAAEKAAAERAAAERAAGITITLSEREKNMSRNLSRNFKP